MGSTEWSRKRIHLWKKAIIHFLVCFVMGFFTGFAPTGKPQFTSFTLTSSLDTPTTPYNNNSLHHLSPPTKLPTTTSSSVDLGGGGSGGYNDSTVSNRSLSESSSEEDNNNNPIPRRQIIVVTPTSDKDALRGVLLNRMADTLRLVAPPLLWVVVESQLESSDVSDILRKTGVMYRHLVFKENFTHHNNKGVEMDFQRNFALKHIEQHRLSGIVHFAGLSNVYDLNFFHEIRAIQGFGTWPIAKMSAKRKKMIIEGPVCQSSQVVGWHIKNINLEEVESGIHISSFGFNSSVLWDPERWGRLPAAEATKQNSLKFVKHAIIEDESKIKGVPSEDCSKVNLWQLHLPSKFVRVNGIPDSTLGTAQR